jgi:hypothetical protein
LLHLVGDLFEKHYKFNNFYVAAVPTQLLGKRERARCRTVMQDMTKHAN